jgi:threonine synthase
LNAGLPEVSRNPHWNGYRCTVCSREYPRDWPHFVCESCGVDGILDAQYDYGAIGRNLDTAAPFPLSQAGGMWRFASLMPVAPASCHSAWTLGATPLHAPARLREALGLENLYLKDDTSLPSASLKDRAAAVAIAHARLLGRDRLACASTGNAAASLAVLGARAGAACTIFVPKSAPAAKLAQLALHGAKVIRVDGTYDEAFDLSVRAIAERGWYSRNCAHNPLLVEGKKTAALELFLDLAGQAPDAVFVPVGDGCIISSIGKAFRELKRLKLIDRLPKLFGVQADGAAPLARAWQAAGALAESLDGQAILALVKRAAATTVADSICVAIPRNRVKAWRNVAASGGAFMSVSDEEILAAVRMLAARAGLFAEPSGAAGLAGLLKARQQGCIEPPERIVVMVTGHGLKDPTAALAGIELPDPVRPAWPLPPGVID